MGLDGIPGEGARIKLQPPPGVLGSTLSDAEAQRHHDPRSTKLTSAEIGCLRSHMLAWERIIEANKSLGLVMEDDLHLSPRLPMLLAQIKLDMNEVGILKLEASPESINIVRRQEFFVDPYSAHKLIGLHSGTGAYLINKKTAEVLYQRCMNAKIPVDLALFDPKQPYNSGILIMQLIPAPCVQDVFASYRSKKNFVSTIGDRLTVEKRQKSAFKKLFRPIYRNLISLYLLKYGIKRTEARFF